MRKHRTTRTLCLAGLFAGMLSTAACNKPASAPPSGATPAPSATVVDIDVAKRRSLRRVVEQPGTVQAYEQTQLFSRVPGHVQLAHDGAGRIVHDIGRPVRGPNWISAGDVLAELAVPELVEETKQKQAMIRQVEAEADQADKALAAARANVAVVEAGTIEATATNDFWDSQWKKMVGLAKSGVVDQQTREETLKQLQASSGRLASAKALVDKAKADRDKAEADLRAATARIDVATADSRRSEAMLGYAKIRAPYDGIVTLRKVNTGDFVQPASGKGDWLFTVARLDPVRVVIAVPEADAELIQDGAEVSVAVPAFPGPNLRGTVARTSWALLESGGRTLRAEIDLPNKDGRLRPGTYVSAQVIRQLPEAWTLPASAVVKHGEAMVCFLVDGDKAVRTPVLIGRSDGQLVEVLKLQKPGSPLWTEWTGHEKVALRAGTLTDGQAVQVGTGK